MLPDWLLWLLPAPLVTLVAFGWAAWANRPRGPEQTEVSVRDHERFRAALGRSVGNRPGDVPGATDGTLPADGRRRLRG